MSRYGFVVVAWLAAALVGTSSCGEVKEDVDASSSPSIDAAAIDASATTPDASAAPDASAPPDAAPPDADTRECTAPDQCPGEDTDCQSRTCVDYTCGFADTSAGETCAGGTMYCDGAGACVECLDNDHCPGEICRDRSCVPATCDDLERNGDETDVDCGGSCSPCANDRGCGDATDCVSGYCNGTTCAACSAHADCAGLADTYCATPGGTCTPKLAQGLTCSYAAQCLSGSCADGKCCDEACTGTCESCDQLGLLGQCKPIASGTDPDDECAGTGLCGGTCNGGGSCSYPPVSTKCGTCTSCDGGGFCANYASANTDPFGDCASCYACNGGGACTAVAGGADPLNDCAMESAATCGRDGSCDGSGSCALWDDTTLCSAPSCTSGVSQPADYCDGAGTCTDSGTVFCDGFACFGPACRTTCGGDGDCLSGYLCAGGDCVECACMTKTCLDYGMECGVLSCTYDGSTCIASKDGCGNADEPWTDWNAGHLPAVGDLTVDVPAVGSLTGYCMQPSGVSSTGTQIFVGDGPIPAGEELIYIGGLTFDLSGLPENADIVSATLNIYQSGTVGTVYSAPLTKVITEHVRYATLSGTCSAPPIEMTFVSQDLSLSPTVGWRSSNVTAALRYDIATCQARTQFRLRFVPGPGRDDDAVNRAEFTSDDAPSENVPYLRVRYR